MGTLSEPALTKPSSSAWWPFLAIILASAFAHLGCLGAQFYMDDASQIRDSEIVRTGNFVQAGLSAWTYMIYSLQYRFFGMSAMAFHAVNWILHTAVACVLLGFGRDFLNGRSQNVALFGALLFAVHPLASEIPNYARTQDIAWVTLFSLLAAWTLLRALRFGGIMKWFLCVFWILGATFSKGPGFFHAAMACGAVGLAEMTPVHWQKLREKVLPLAIGLMALFLCLSLAGFLSPWSSSFHHWSETRFIGHGYTVARVFWEFAWRSVAPFHLSSDHHIAEMLVSNSTPFWNIPDKIAMIAAVGLLALVAVSIFLAWRKPTRQFGVCLMLFVATILLRVFYLIPEFMPEYRIYPGLPWFCLGAAIFLAAGWRKLTTISPRIPAGILIMCGILISAQRSYLWGDLDRLLADVLKQYPTQARAIWELNDRDAIDGKWQKIIERQRKIWPVLETEFLKENRRLAPRRELPTGHMALAAVACMGHYAVAISHQEGSAAGLREIDRLERFMHQLGLDPKAHALHWNYFYHRKALVLEIAGDYQTAAESIQKSEMTYARKQDLERIQKKITDTKI